MSKVFYPSVQDYKELEDHICGYFIEWDPYPVEPLKPFEPAPHSKTITSSDYIITTGSSSNPCENCPNKGKSNACFCTLPYVLNPSFIC